MRSYAPANGEDKLRKCLSCDAPIPGRADHLISDESIRPAAAKPRYSDIEEFLKKSPEERMAYWQAELGRCVKCYACRQACPLCYCRQCIVEKNRPQCISTSASLKGNFAYHIARAFHQAGRCVGCDECTRVCPAGIDLRLLNLALAKAAEENFSYRSGVDPDAEPIIGRYSENDKETFIR
jgi:ferredoxin